MTTASELLKYAVEAFKVKLASGQTPSFDTCLREALHVHELNHYPKIPLDYKAVGKLGSVTREDKAVGLYLYTGAPPNRRMRKIIDVVRHFYQDIYVKVRVEGTTAYHPYHCNLLVYES